MPNDLKKKADKEKIAKASWKEMEERMKDWNEQVAMIRYVKLRIEKGLQANWNTFFERKFKLDFLKKL